MKLNKIPFVLIVATLMFASSCKKNAEPIDIAAIDFHNSVDMVSKVMVHDIFSPPVASRVFAYPNIAAYEIIAQHNDAYNSLKGQITHLGEIPVADTSKKHKL